MKLHHKIIWITGASSGIGEATAVELAKKQNTLILSARRKDELERVARVCEQHGGTCMVMPVDITQPTQIKKVVNLVNEKFGKVDVLFNNGGISQRSLVHETPLEVDRQVMEVDYFGHITLTKAVLPLMIKNNGGLVAINTSISGKFGFPLRSAYCAAKHALHGFYDSLRAELYSQNIKVCIIVPGRIQTNISFNAITKTGEKYGVMDGGQKHGIPVSRCAKKIVKSFEKQKKEVLIGGKELLLAHFKRFIPTLYYYLARKIKPT